MVSAPTFWSITLAAALAAAGCSSLEWRRANRLRLIARLAATFLAVTALALLGLRPVVWQPAVPAAGRLRAVLWTPLDSPAPLPDLTGIDASHRFVLPDAARLDPAAVPVPDAAFLRRRFPEIGTLRILGDGLDPAELDALRGLRVEYKPPPSHPGAPGIRFLHCPRELNLGDPLVIQGRLGGLAPNTNVTLTLEAPDGATTSAPSTPADAAGETPFTIQAASPPSIGRFLWRLRAPAAANAPALDVSLGVAVIPPDLPRLLVLESAPRFDTAALRRWFEQAGGTLIARAQIGQDRYQYTSAAAASPPPFTALDAPFLAGFDLLLADARALLALPPAERDTLLRAVADTGFGVLVLPDDAPLPVEPNPLLPWKLSPVASDSPGGDRPARLQWPGQAVPTDLPIPAAPFEIVPGRAQRPLLGDRQGHTLAAADPRGRGQLALTLVRDTTRWQRENDPAAFATYWSFLFSQLARPAADATGHWALLDGDAGPAFVDHPLSLLWSGPPGPPPGRRSFRRSPPPTRPRSPSRPTPPSRAAGGARSGRAAPVGIALLSRPADPPSTSASAPPPTGPPWPPTAAAPPPPASRKLPRFHQPSPPRPPSAKNSRRSGWRRSSSFPPATFGWSGD